jgi:non-ribosomal peptide synthetase component F
VPLLTGGCCVVLSDEAVQTPGGWRHPATGGIDTLFVTAALFNAVVDEVPDCFSAVGQVWWAASSSTPRRSAAGTATTPAAHRTRQRLRTDRVPRPSPSTIRSRGTSTGRGADRAALPQTGAVLVVTAQERVAAPGEVAELLLSGAGLAAGYRNLPEETARRFVRLPWLDGGGSATTAPATSYAATTRA